MQRGADNQVHSQQRRHQIVALLRDQGTTSINDLAHHFFVSAETIRRDVRFLDERGQVTRAYGSVTAVETSVFERPGIERTTRNIPEKRRIAREAARHIEDAATIFIDEGTIPGMVTDFLPDRELTVITTSLATAASVSRLPHITAIAVGGRVRPITLGVVDHWALGMVESMSIDLAFIGANGVDREGWLSAPDPAVATMKRAAIASSHRAIFIGDHTKFEHQSFVRFVHLRSLHMAITDTGLRKAAASRLSTWGTPLVRV